MEPKEEYLEFYFGKIGGAVPIILVFLVMLLLSCMGYTNGKCFWAAGVIAILSGYLLIKDKSKFEQILVDGITDSGLGKVMIMFLLTGIVSVLLSECGLCDGLLYLVLACHLSSAILPAIIFLFSIVLTFATGATSMTIAAATPIFLPVAIKLGCQPGVIMGAIMGGGLLGDNVAPITASNVTAALTQGVSVKEVTAARTKYVLVTSFFSCMIYLYLGLRGNSGIVNMVSMDASNLKSLAMLICPGLLIGMIVKGRTLMEALCVELLSAILISILLGKVTFDSLFCADGVFVTGMQNSLPVIVLCMMIYMILQILHRSGIFESMTTCVLNHCRHYKTAELFVAVAISLGSAMLGGAAYAIVLLGPLAKQLFEQFHLDATRAGSILGCFSSAIVGLIPFSTVVLYAITMAQVTKLVDEDFSAMNIIPYAYPSMLLLGIYLLAIILDIGRVFEKQGMSVMLK